MAINNTSAIAIFSAFALEALNEELATIGMPPMADTAMAATILVAGIRSQGEFAALAINIAKGDVTSDSLRDLLRAAFPEAKIGDRHGGHYLCHARTGGLKGCRFKPPTANQRRNGGKPKGKRVDEMTAAELLQAAQEAAAREAAAAKPTIEEPSEEVQEPTPEAEPETQPEPTAEVESIPDGGEAKPKRARRNRAKAA